MTEVNKKNYSWRLLCVFENEHNTFHKYGCACMPLSLGVCACMRVSDKNIYYNMEC